MKKFWQKIKNIVLKIKQKIDKVKVKYKIAAAVVLVLAAVFGCIAHLYYKTSELYHISGVFYHKIGGLEQQVGRSQRIFVYNLEKVVEAIKLSDIKSEFEDKIKKISDEVAEAKKKISSLKDSKVKTDFSDIYVKSLSLKRDEAIEEYNKEMTAITDKINAALQKIANHYGIATIYNTNMIAVSTPYVIDVTPDVIKLVNAMSSQPTGEK